jgi:hypothetical protein
MSAIQLLPYVFAFVVFVAMMGIIIILYRDAARYKNWAAAWALSQVLIGKADRNDYGGLLYDKKYDGFQSDDGLS